MMFGATEGSEPVSFIWRERNDSYVLRCPLESTRRAAAFLGALNCGVGAPEGDSPPVSALDRSLVMRLRTESPSSKIVTVPLPSLSRVFPGSGAKNRPLWLSCSVSERRPSLPDGAGGFAFCVSGSVDTPGVCGHAAAGMTSHSTKMRRATRMDLRLTDGQGSASHAIFLCD